MGTAVLALAQMVLTSLTVGLLPGGYRPLPLLGANALVFIALFVWCLWTGRFSFRKGLAPEERPYVVAIAAVIGVTLPVWLWELLNGLLLPPVYWDELYYHLVAPAVWARDGQIHFFATGNPFVAGYPANFGLIPGWMMVMTGNDVWADLTGFPFVFLGLMVVIAYCRRLGVSPWHSFWAGLLFVTTPMVIFHSKAAYIDLPLSVVFGVASYFLYLYAADGRRRHLVTAALAMGLLVGAKYSGLYMAIAGLLPIFYSHFKTSRFRRPRWLNTLACYFGPILLLGGFFYLRNIIMYGNPLHPMRLDILGVTVFAGKYLPGAFNFTAPENTWWTLAKSILETEPRPEMDSFYAGFGPQLLLLAIPAVIIFLVLERNRRGIIVTAWLIPLLITVATLPAMYPRYLIHISLFLLPFAAWLLDNLSRWWGRLLKFTAVTFAAYSVLIATPIYTVLPQHYQFAAQTVWAVNRAGLGAQYAYIVDLNEKRGGPLRIASSNLRMTYPLMGQRWQNEILYVKPTSEEQWLKGIVEAKADLFAIDATWEVAREASQESEWVVRHPEQFRLLFTDTRVTVYLVIPGDSDHQDFVHKLEPKVVQ